MAYLPNMLSLPFEKTATVTTFILGMWILYILGGFLYNIYFHPLAGYPGPRSAAAARFWWVYHTLKGDILQEIKKLHEQYGDVIRIAPDELCFTAPNAWKDIYGHRQGRSDNEICPEDRLPGWPKYQPLITADPIWHAHLKRVLAPAFTDKFVRENEHSIHTYINFLLRQLKEQGNEGQKPLDMSSWYNYITFDFIGQLVLHEPFNCLLNASYHSWIVAIQQALKFIVFLRALTYFPILVKASNILMSRTMVRKRKLHDQLTREKVLRRKALAPPDMDAMTLLINSESKGELEELDTIKNGEVLILAGSETVATLLAGVTYLLLTHPSKMEKLCAEIRSFPSIDDITLSSVSKINYLLPVINEGLRIYPPGPGCHRRFTPPEGSVINGTLVPGNTRVGICALAAHRSDRNFHDAESFIPERWLEKDERFKDDRREAFQPFLYGPRMCMGKSFAYAEMQLILAKVLYSFDLSLEEESRDWMNQRVFGLWEKPPLMVRLKPVKLSS